MPLTGKGVAFDGSIRKSPGLTVSFSRATATKDMAGTDRGANQPRYARRRLLAGVISDGMTSHFSVAGTGLLLACGYAADNTTPLWVVRNDLNAQLILWSGTFSGGGNIANINLTGAPGRAAGAITALNTAGATTDLFRSQSSITNYVNECWVPKAAVICHGIMAVQCQVFVNTGADSDVARAVAANWKSQYIGVAFCKTSTFISSPGTGWRTTPPRTGQIHTATAGSIGTPWVIRWEKLDRDGTVPVKAWVTGADYQNHTNANGGLAYVIPMTRTSTTSDDWAEDEAAQTYTTSLAGDLRHVHNSIVVRTGTLGIRQVVTSGDNLGNQAVMNLELTSEGSATAADTTYRAGGSVAADARRWNTGTLTNWNTIASTGTGSGIDSGTITATGTSVTPSTTYAGNQFVGMGYDGQIICGSDEASDIVTALTPGAPGTPLTFTPLWAPYRVRLLPPTGTPALLSNSTQCFYVAERNKLTTGGGWVALCAPGANYTNITAGARVLFSPNGTDVCEVYPAGNTPDLPVHSLAGRIYFNSALGTVSSIAEPADYRAVRPIQIAPGGLNYANTSYTVTDTSSGQCVTTEVSGSNIPSGLPAMAGTTSVLHMVHDGTSSANCCTIRLADTVPITAKEIIVSFWVYNTPCASRSPAVSSPLNLSGYMAVAKNSDGSSATTSGNLLRTSIVTQGSWAKVTIRAALPPLLAFGSDTARITLGLFVNNGSPGPYDFYWARDSVMVCNATTGADASGYPIAPGVTGADESLTITGLNAPVTSDWTLVASLHVPREPHWDEGHAPVFYSAAAVNVDATSTTLTGGPSTDYITGGLLRIGTTANSGISGVRITAYNTTTKLATHEALTGISAGTVTATVFKPLYDTGASIDRPRQLLALLTADEQKGVVLFANTSKSLAGEDGHSFGIALVTGGAVDWATYSDFADGIEWIMSGDLLTLMLECDSSSGWFLFAGYVGGAPIVLTSDFGTVYGSFTNEVFTTVRLGGIGTPNALDVSGVWLEPSLLSNGDANAALGALDFYDGAYRYGSPGGHRLPRAPRAFRLHRV